MSESEWESLCDGCARCCLLKLEDEDEEVYTTSVACRYLDSESCRCTQYKQRTELVAECLRITKINLHDILRWMPPTCAYRLLATGQPLPDWHPLVSGDPETVHDAGISIRAFAISEEQLRPEDALESFIFTSEKV